MFLQVVILMNTVFEQNARNVNLIKLPRKSVQLTGTVPFNEGSFQGSRAGDLVLFPVLFFRNYLSPTLLIALMSSSSE